MAVDRDEMSPWNRSIIPDKANRERDDFYPTPPCATRALLAVEPLFNPVWEPACGDGAMSKVIEEAGYLVHSTDLIDRGYGQGGVDFLLDYTTYSKSIVTNPPFKMAKDFVLHGLARSQKVCIFARLQFLESKPRRALFEEKPFKRVIVFSDRVPMQRGRLVEDNEQGGRMTAYAWFVWENGYEGSPTISWVETDKEGAEKFNG